MIANADELRYEGESIYQSAAANGPFGSINPTNGVTLKELVSSQRNRNEVTFGFVKKGNEYGADLNEDSSIKKKLSLT